MATAKRGSRSRSSAPKKDAADNAVKDTNGDVVGSTVEKQTIVPGHAGRSVPASRQYGESTPEEHRKSGYRYPASFYKKPIPAEERVEGGPTHEEPKARKSAPENKASTKTEDAK